jgi:hypothetical protein
MNTNTYTSLMERRVRRILLVCNNYDSFALEEDGRIDVQIAQEYAELNLSNPPSITRAETTDEALDLVKSQKSKAESHDADAPFDQFAATLFVGFDTVHAVFSHYVKSVHHYLCTLEATLSHRRFHCVQLHLSRFVAHRYAQVVTNHFVADLVHYLGDNGIHLTGHNGTAGLTGRQVNLVQTAFGT